MFKDVDIDYIVMSDSELLQPLQDLPRDEFYLIAIIEDKPLMFSDMRLCLYAEDITLKPEWLCLQDIINDFKWAI